jgi:hypothetical protein
MTSVWDIAACYLIEVYRHFRGAYFLHHDGDRPDDEGSIFLRNVGIFL